MKRYEVHIRIIDRRDDVEFLRTTTCENAESVLEHLDAATEWAEFCDDYQAEPTERQLEWLASPDRHPDYAYMQAEARKLK